MQVAEADGDGKESQLGASNTTTSTRTSQVSSTSSSYSSSISGSSRNTTTIGIIAAATSLVATGGPDLHPVV